MTIKNLFFLKASIATMLVQSFVVSNVVKGLVPSYIFIFLQFAKDAALGTSKKVFNNVLVGILKFIAIFAAFQLISQFLNAVFHPNFEGLILVSFQSSEVVLFRKSLFTQSLYLTTCVLFFLYLYNHLKNDGGVDKIIKLVKIGVIIYVLYGFYEWIGYLLIGQSVDFLSNRITGLHTKYGFQQKIELGGISLRRMKSLAGEPSMFAYSVMPFVVLFYYLKDKIYILFMAAVFLSTATTGILGIVFFMAIETIFRLKKSFRLLAVTASGLVFALIFFYEPILDFYYFTFKKIDMQHMSSITRLDSITKHTNFFLNSDVLHMLFGYGFGYVRPNSGFCSLLVNTGLIGTVAFILFFLYPFLKMKLNSDYRKGLLTAISVVILMLLIATSELYYLHIWFLAALSWYELYKDRRGSYDNS